MQEIYNKYFEVSSNESFYKYSSDPFSQIIQNEFDFKSIIELINLSSINEEQNEAYLYNEYSNPIPMKYIDESKCRSKTDYEIASNSSVWNKNFLISVPKINQKLNSKCDTIQLMNKYYQFCIKVVQLFPSFVNIIINDKLEGKNSDIEKEVNNCFYKLLHIYKNLLDKDKSLISSTTNLYIESFVTMIANFKKNGINFGNSLPINFNTSDKLKQDILHYPEKDTIYIPLNEFDNEIYEQFFSPDPPNIEEFSNIYDEAPDILIDHNNYINYNNRHLEEEEEDDDDDLYENIYIERNEQINGESFVFEDEDVKNAINKMKSMPKNSKICQYIERKSKIVDYNNSIFSDIINKIERKSEFNNYFNQLMKQSLYLYYKIVTAFKDINTVSSEYAVNILVYCSKHIKAKYKMFNMMIVCALTEILTLLKIPYSVATVIDNTTYIMKDFKKSHSQKYLQKICYWLLFSNSQTKLSSLCKFAIDNMQYLNDENDKGQKERPYRSIFVFSEGLDEELALSNSWKEEILSNDKISFGFIFIESALLKENLNFIEQFWNEFESEVSTSKSKLKIAAIKPKINNELSKRLIDLIKAVMNIDTTNEKTKQHNYEYAKVNFITEIDYDGIREFVKKTRSSLNLSNFNITKSFFAKSTQVLQNINLENDEYEINKIDQNPLKKFEPSIKDFGDVCNEIFIKPKIIDQSSLKKIFRSNKENQYTLISNDEYFDLTKFVLLFNSKESQMINFKPHIEKICKYDVKIVISPSFTCFNDFTLQHTLKTINEILFSLFSLDIDFINLVAAGNPNPNIIYSGSDYKHNKEYIFSVLLEIYRNPLTSIDLSSAIKVAYDIKKMRCDDFTSILLVLTDGNYNNEECDRILNTVNICVKNGINTFGISIGYFTKEIIKLFPQVVYAPNPSDVMKALATFYDNSIISSYSHKIYIQLLDDLEFMNKYDFCYMCNEEKSIFDENGNVINPVGENTELYIKDLLKTQKILIVMLWDSSLDFREDWRVHPMFIEKPSEPGSKCIKDAVEHFGITLKIVRNYEDAIGELTNSNSRECNYYAVWVFCGPPYKILPENKGNPNLVIQFNDILIEFWKNGGSIVFFAQSDPLTYQVNLFLETVKFENEPKCPSGKAEFRIGNYCIGINSIFNDIPSFGETNHHCRLNRNLILYGNICRTKISHNIGALFEGYSSSYIDCYTSIEPFQPFSIDSKGRCNALFYPANPIIKTGDIFIDCDYKKFFLGMNEDGVFRYIQNIAGWTARPEIHKYLDDKHQHIWRPKKIHIHNNNSVIKPRFQIKYTNPKSLKALWIIECSKFVNNNDLYYTELERILKENYKDGDEIYLCSNKYTKVLFDKLNLVIKNKEGEKGHNVVFSAIYNIISESTIRQHLIIVTTGLFSRNKAIIYNDIDFEFVSTFYILYGNDRKVVELNESSDFRNLKINADFSIDNSFSNNCLKKAYLIYGANKMIEIPKLSQEESNCLQNIDSINSIEEFNNKFEILARAVYLSTNGNKYIDYELARKIDNLYLRICKKSNEKQNNQCFEIKINKLRRMAEGYYAIIT